MRTNSFAKGRGSVIAALVLALSGCHRPAPPAETPAPEAPAPAAPAAAPAAETTGATANPVPDASPELPAAKQTVATSSQGREPAVNAMNLAKPPSKLGVPVDLRYQFDGDVKTGQPVTLHLAAVPRVTGSNLKVSIKEDAGVSATTGTIAAQKADASTAYRQLFSVTKLANGPSELRVLVSMDVAEGSAFGWFSVPLARAPVADKQARAPQE